MSDLVFILPIWLIFGTQELGLSVTLTTVLFMTIWLGSGFLEIPTGALADRLGRKRMFLIGSALLAAYPLIYAIEAPVALIFAVNVVAAFGSALRSGTLVPLTHDSYKKDGRSDKDYHAFLSNEKMCAFIARGLSGVVGGLLYAADPRAPFVAMFVVYVLIFALGWLVVDESDRSTLSQTKHIAQSIHSMLASKPIVMMIGCYISLNLIAEAIWTAYQPFFVADKLSIELIGIIFSGLALVSAVGAYCVRFVMRRVGVLRLELMLGGLMTATALLLATPSKLLHVLSVVPIAFAFGMTVPPLVATIQKYVVKKFHSTALSVVGLLQYGVYGIASLYVSVLIDLWGTDVARQLLCFAAVIVTVLMVLYYLRHKQADIIISTDKPIAETEEGLPAGA